MSTLEGKGWVRSDDPEEAELIVVNSCGFIESAKKESLQAVISAKIAYPTKKILLAGCLAERYADDLFESLPEADGFLGNADLSIAAEVAEATLSGARPVGKPAVDPSGVKDFATCSSDRPLLSLPGSAYLKISEGCDNRCTFCAIPLIRGGLRSRSIESAYQEAAGLLSRGVKELCLVGQDLGSFGLERSGRCELPELLDRLSTLEGQFWIRLLYIHPDRFPDGLLERCAADPRILPYFDLPFQHASAPILKAMNRRGNADAYVALIERIRSALPESTIRSTFLVGFPGETDDDFQVLQDFQRRARIDWLGAFEYSREEGTAAYGIKGRVLKKAAAARRRAVEDAQIPITEDRLSRFIGVELDILVEESVEGEEGLYLGRCRAQAPEVDGAMVLHSADPLQVGSFVRGVVFRRAGFDLEAAVRSGGDA